MSRWLVLLGLALAGCAPMTASRASLDRQSARIADERVVRPSAPHDESEPLGDRPVSESSRAPEAEGRGSRFAFFDVSSETRVIGRDKAVAVERPRHTRFIDLHLQRAKTADALQFLADSGGFNLVLEGELAAPVTVSLHHVDPFDALEAIAEAQHLEVEVRRGIVTVGGH